MNEMNLRYVQSKSVTRAQFLLYILELTEQMAQMANDAEYAKLADKLHAATAEARRLVAIE